MNSQNEDIEYTKEIFRCLILTIESPTLFELALLADLPLEVLDDEDSLKRYIRRCGGFVTMTEDNGETIIEWIDVAAKEHLKAYANDELSLKLDDVQHGIIGLRSLEHVRGVFQLRPSEPDDVENQSDRGNQATNAADQGSVTGSIQSEPVNENNEELDQDASQVEDPSSHPEYPEQPNLASSYHVDTPLPQGDQQIDDSIDGCSSNAPEESQDHDQFLHYAVMYWIEHAMQAPADIVEEFDLNDEFWAKESVTRARWWDTYSQQNRYAGVTGITPLHLAALTGYPALLDYLLESGRPDEIQSADSWGYTPLAWACDHGDISTVDRLRKAGADVNKAGALGGPTALWAASFCGHMEIIQYLLEHGADVNASNVDRGSSLYVAASGCFPEVVRELLLHKANPNLSGGSHVRPLNVAAYSGYTEIVQILLEHGVDCDPDDDYRYGSALGAAARRGHAEIIRILLQKGWKVNRKLKAYDSPLVASATYGHAEAVQVLLEQGVEGVSRVRALEVASKNGRTEVVKLLLEQTPYIPHEKAFHNAASFGRDDVLELLEKRGTNAEMLNLALYNASDQERESTVNLLLRFGADPNAEGKE